MITLLALASHRVDMLIPRETVDHVSTLLEQVLTGKPNDRHAKTARVCATIITCDSPYREVRAVVAAKDHDIPALTIRSWVIGMILVQL